MRNYAATLKNDFTSRDLDLKPGEREWLVANGARYYPDQLILRKALYQPAISEWRFDKNFDEYRCVEIQSSLTSCVMIMKYEEHSYSAADFDQPHLGRKYPKVGKGVFRLEFIIDQSDYKFEIAKQWSDYHRSLCRPVLAANEGCD